MKEPLAVLGNAYGGIVVLGRDSLWLCPDALLFIERGVYLFELPFEYAICCRELGLDEEAIRIANQLISHPQVPAGIARAVRSLWEGG